MSRKYKFHNPEGVYFISFAVVESGEKGVLDNVIVIK